MSERLRRLADSYLDHIRIAVEAGDRGAPFRDFFDNWNAFRSDAGHHRSRGERPRWFNNPSALARLDMLGALDFRSAGAEVIMARAKADAHGYREKFDAKDKEVRLIVDHAVPIGVMVDMLFRIPDGTRLNRAGIQAFLTRWYRLGLLSHAQNSVLNGRGLSSKMPAGWDYTNCFARYAAVGIVAARV